MSDNKSISSVVTEISSTNDSSTKISFTPQQIQLCKQLVKSRQQFEKLARDMYDSWADKGWVPEFEESNYQIVWRNAPLKKALLLYLAQQLSTELEDLSTMKLLQSYGCGIISPFDMYFNCYTDNDLNQFIREKGLMVTSQQYKELQGARQRTLNQMTNLRRDIIEAVHLAGTPTRSYKPIIDNSKVVKVFNSTDVQNRIDSITDQLSASAASGCMGTGALENQESDDDNDNNDDDNGNNEVELESVTVGGEIAPSAGKRKAENPSLKDQLLSSYPAIATTGIILLINDDEIEVIPVSCATCTRCNQPMG